MFVLKFGGTSVGSPEAISRIIDILKDGEHAGKTAAVVVSAFSGLTDGLIDIARRASVRDMAYAELVKDIRKRHIDVASCFLKGEGRKKVAADTDKTIAELGCILEGIAVIGELSDRIMDLVMSFGERLSAALLAHIFSASGIDAAYLDARALVKTSAEYGKAECLYDETIANIRAFFACPGGREGKKPPLQVVTGFIGATPEGQTTTLGRGGSDLSAAIFGAALEAQEVEIWTDVDGILTADPKLVKTAFRIDEISYIEAMEISHFGAKVLFPPTVKPALEKGIPIRIRNTFNPAGGGTRISRDASDGTYPIRGISSMHNIALVRIQGSGMVGTAGFSARVFSALAARGINIILISQSSSEYSICFAVLPEDVRRAEAALKEEFEKEIRRGAIEEPASERDLSIIAVVGSRMKSTSGISGKVFHALGRNGVNVVAIAQGSSEINISAVISRQDEGKALNAIHEAFFLAGHRSVNLFLLGTGLIGGTLLDQIASHREILADKDKIRINLVGAANSRHMIFRREGLDPKKVKILLAPDGKEPREGRDGSAESFNLSAFIEKMISLNLPNTAFCDCTASDDVSASYGGIIQSSIPIITPNKRANAGSFDYYRRLTAYSRERGIPYLYETTVCAGLPVISTLRDLFLSGDRVRRIEAVLSGTLSFIFNNFDGSRPFSALVREAKAKGYTEPDPRDDLNATDAARKALILARECGMSLEFANVNIEPILPAPCFRAPDVDTFFKELEKSDAAFEKRRSAAAAAGRSLRYVAVIEEGAAKLSLREESGGSPFCSLVDSDNIVVITTDRYSKLPMIIKGPGAGAQVTAGGVFADIVRIARTLV
ncbi:MAG: bifunctional aspartate kinase/homoserine dehydrogenase I [Treponema sp.]|jgi:aspartokinase/homoserine dehydrogenase 1|nr:bifunctional aspartate kinase/homoserine dehydrogenase I [Treponema sp.]